MKCRPNIVLIGLMGTGKTSVGRRLACELGVDFLDLDELIVKEAGMPIKDIFAGEGAGSGEAHFRALEAEAVKRVTTEMDSLVLSVGGGAVIDAANRRALRGWGKVVCLKASVETILERVGGGDDERPLLNDGDKTESIARLLEEREPFYNESDLVVDTDSIRVGKVVEVIKCFLSRSGRP